VGGWGFSNAAEGFVFLSGMSFGWVYSKRIEQVGKYRSALKVIYRTFKTYCAFLVTLIAIWQIGRYAFEFSTVKRILDFHLSIEIVFLREQPAFVGVLCLYIIIIPFQLLLLFFLQRFWWLSFILSSFLFLLASQFPGFNLHTRTGNWIFNPFTWQFLMFIGVVTGSRMQKGVVYSTSSSYRLILALLVLLLGIFCKKGYLVVGREQFEMLHEFLNTRTIIGHYNSTPAFGLLRLFHFLALVHLIAALLSFGVIRRAISTFQLLRTCGRNSLPVYCVGVLITYFVGIACDGVGHSKFFSAIAILDACLIQFVVAIAIDKMHSRERV